MLKIKFRTVKGGISLIFVFNTLFRIKICTLVTIAQFSAWFNKVSKHIQKIAECKKITSNLLCRENLVYLYDSKLDKIFSKIFSKNGQYLFLV